MHLALAGAGRSRSGMAADHLSEAAKGVRQMPHWRSHASSPSYVTGKLETIPRTAMATGGALWAEPGRRRRRAARLPRSDTLNMCASTGDC